MYLFFSTNIDCTLFQCHVLDPLGLHAEQTQSLPSRGSWSGIGSGQDHCQVQETAGTP